MFKSHIAFWTEVFVGFTMDDHVSFQKLFLSKTFFAHLAFELGINMGGSMPF